MNRTLWLIPFLFACQRTPTYTTDIAPLLDKHCKSCHFDGGIGPFPLLSYQDAKENAFDIADEVEEGDMPPFHADSSGACNTFEDAAILTPEEIDTIVRWAKGGAPEGTPSTPLAPPLSESLPNPELITTMAEPYQSQKVDFNGNPSADDIRCFIVDTGLTQDQFMTSFEVIPDHPEIAHHMVLFRLDDPQAEQEAAEFDASNEVDAFGRPLLDANGQPFNNPGYDCPGDSGIRRGKAPTIATWAPGRNVRSFPEGTGIPLKANQKLIIQMHYNYGISTGVPVSLHQGIVPFHGTGERPADQSSLAFRLVDSVDQALSAVRFGPLRFEIPVGQDSTSISLETPPAPAGIPTILVHAMFPHMHQRGESLKVSLGPSGLEECAIHVPDWDYHWQDTYVYETPLVINEGDRLKIECEYRTRGDISSDFEEGFIGFGEQTQDEMCFNFLFIACPDIPTGCPQEIIDAIESIN